MGDENFNVDFTFFGKNTELLDQYKEGDVIEIKNYVLNPFKTKPGMPQDLKHTTLYPPKITSIKVLKEDDIPDDLKSVKIKTSSISGMLLDIDDMYSYSSCNWKEGKCRVKINNPSEECPSCGFRPEDNNFYQDYVITLVIGTEDNMKRVKVFR